MGGTPHEQSWRASRVAGVYDRRTNPPQTNGSNAEPMAPTCPPLASPLDGPLQANGSNATPMAPTCAPPAPPLDGGGNAQRDDPSRERGGWAGALSRALTRSEPRDAWPPDSQDDLSRPLTLSDSMLRGAGAPDPSDVEYGRLLPSRDGRPGVCRANMTHIRQSRPDYVAPLLRLGTSAMRLVLTVCRMHNARAGPCYSPGHLWRDE